VRALRVLSLGLLVALPPCAPVWAAAAGVVVEKVRPRSAGATAGLQPGDVILEWSCAASPPGFPQPTGGVIRSPYDLLPLEIEESPRRAVTLRGERGDEEKTWTLGAPDWGIETRPATESTRSDGDGRLAAWLLNQRAEELGTAGKWPEADAAYGEALAILERESDPAASQLLRRWGDTLMGRGAWDAAAERFQKALALDRAMAPKSLAVARSLDALGVMTAKKGGYAAAGELLRQALAIREELAPGTTLVAGSLNKLGILARLRGDLEAAGEYLTRAEELQRRLAPGSFDHALIFMNLGNVAFDRDDLESAENLQRQALAIFEKTDPGAGVGALQNLVNIAIKRGDLAAADDMLRRILALQEKDGLDGWETWRVLMNLGHLAASRSDMEASEAHYHRALDLAEKLSPQGNEVALGLSGLGEAALQRGDFVTARLSLRRAQEITDKLAPDNIDSALGLEDLARLETDGGGDLARAERLLRRALAIFERQAPESLYTATVLRHLGEIAARRGRLREARGLYHRALALQSRIAPGSADQAVTLYSLGRVERRAGQFREGTRDLCHAVDILDRQRVRLGGTPEARTSFEADFGGQYHSCLEGLLGLGRSAEAFHVLERGRARSFLALLAERDLRFQDLPPALAVERRRLNAEYDRVQSRLASLSAGRDGVEIERIASELSALRARQEWSRARIRRESPRSAALQDPQPLDLAGARAALDPGTMLLAYAVGPEKTWLFVVQPAGAKGSGLSIFPVPLGAKKLHAEVEGFRLLLKDPGSDPGALQAQGRRLYDRLVRPAEARIAGAKRLLISADGPLHTLSFAALRRGDRYLVEWKPIHSVLSATVYAELAKSRPPRPAPGEERLVAFGAPVYRPPAPNAPADPEVREAVRRGLTLRPLPASAREVRSIAALYPRAQVYLGLEATEERAKSIGPESRLVHFACHGLLDERFPLNSALALSPPGPAEGRDNGLLQAWEIFESVRLDADLVTLSACDTALGREMGGEGLVGLTRAFQFAGARSVLASLWGVADLSTARFMASFYGHLRGGKPKDEALRAAQIDQIRAKTGLSHPFHWAAFQLTGDWR
jgi:CHAT domain-containing protein/tetratricopeptide (TPR) repeat protein